MGTVYDLETAKRVKSPNYFVQVKNWGGSDRWFAFKPVKGATRSYILGLGNIKAISQTITPEEGRASIGSLRFSLQDKADRITALVASAVKNKEAVLWGGYDEIDESEYIPLSTNLVDGFDIGESLIEYMFKTADIQRTIKKDIFKPKTTTLTAQLNAAATTATVDDTSAFLTVVHPKLGTCGYIRIEDEIIKWTAKTATTFTIARAQFGTTDVQHSVDSDITELIVFEEHPIAIGLKVLTSTGAGTNGTYDTLPSHWSLGVSQSLVDVTQWENDAEAWIRFNKADLTYGYQFRFIYDGKVDGKRFIEDEILTVLNAYAPITVTGALSFKAFAPPVPFASLNKLDEKVAKVKSMDGGHAAIINIAFFEYDHDLIQDKYMKNIEYSDGQSISDHGESARHEISSRGLRSELNGDNIVLERWNRIKQRFKNPVPLVKVQAFYSQHLLDVGELVDLSYPKLPDTEKGIRGMDRVTEIVNKSFDIMGGAVHYDVMLTGFGRRYALYAPDTVPSYDSATDEEKNKYAFLADNNGKLGAANDEAKVFA